MNCPIREDHTLQETNFQTYHVTVLESPYVAVLISTQVMFFTVILSTFMTLSQCHVTCQNLTLQGFTHDNKFEKVLIHLSQLARICPP